MSDERISHSLNAEKLPCPSCLNYLRPLRPEEQNRMPLFSIGKAGMLFQAKPALPDHHIVFVCDFCWPLHSRRINPYPTPKEEVTR